MQSLLIGLIVDIRGEPYALYIKNFFIHLRSKMGERFINIAASKRKKSLTLTIQRGNQLQSLKLTASDIEEVKETIRECTNAGEEEKAVLSTLTSSSSGQ